jgi:N-acetylglucosamine kinase-like BadF-type ATPase
VQGLNAFSRMIDGRLPRGPLADAVLEAVGVPAPLDVIGVVTDGWDRGRIAALSRVVAAAADAGDAAAQDVLDRAGAELAGLARAVRTGIGAPEDAAVPLSWSGGMFAAPRVLAAFRRAVGDGWSLRTPLHGPAIGAALHARRLAG